MSKYSANAARLADSSADHRSAEPPSSDDDAAIFVAKLSLPATTMSELVTEHRRAFFAYERALRRRDVDDPDALSPELLARRAKAVRAAEARADELFGRLIDQAPTVIEEARARFRHLEQVDAFAVMGEDELLRLARSFG